MSADNMKSLLKLFESTEQSTKQQLNEGIMDVVKQTFNDCVVGYPMGTSEGQFIQGWARAIRAETGRDISLEKLTKLYQDYIERSDEIMQSHGTMDEGIDQNDEGWPHGKPAEPNVLVIVGNALDAAIRSIQKELGNKSGDVAAHFFDSEAGETIMEILKDYVQQEIAMSDDLAEGSVDSTHQKIINKEKTKTSKVPKNEYDRKVEKYLKKKHSDMTGKKSDEELNEITGDDTFDNMMGKIVKGARYKGAAADQRADAAFGGMMNNVTKNVADVAKPSADSKFEQIYSAVERTLLNSHVHSEIDSDIMDVLEKLKIKATDALIQKLERELINRVSDALQYYDDSDLEENFGGGMRDRPGSDTKSFDLAECKAFLAKRVLKG